MKVKLTRLLIEYITDPFAGLHFFDETLFV